MNKKARSYPRIRGRIIELYGSQENFSNVIGKSKTSVSQKLNGSSGFSYNDIVLWAKVLKISVDDIGIYFFSDELAVV